MNTPRFNGEKGYSFDIDSFISKDARNKYFYSPPTSFFFQDFARLRLKGETEA